MVDLQIQNTSILIDKVIDVSKKLLDGNADVIFDGIHDPIQFWFICGQAKLACQLNQMGRLSDGATNAFLEVFLNGYRETIEKILNNEDY